MERIFDEESIFVETPASAKVSFIYTCKLSPRFIDTHAKSEVRSRALRSAFFFCSSAGHAAEGDCSLYKCTIYLCARGSTCQDKKKSLFQLSAEESA